MTNEDKGPELVGWLWRYMRGPYYITCPECGKRPGYSCFRTERLRWPNVHPARATLWESYGELQRVVAKALWEQSFGRPPEEADVQAPVRIILEET